MDSLVVSVAGFYFIIRQKKNKINKNTKVLSYLSVLAAVQLTFPPKNKRNNCCSVFKYIHSHMF